MIEKGGYSTYPGFDEPLAAIKKFKFTGDLFSIMLADGRITHYTADDEISIKAWLLDMGIEDIGDSTTID